MKMQNMKICKLDRLGRVVIPKPMRSLLGETDTNTTPEVKVSVDGNKIVIEKAIPECTICSATEQLIDFNGKQICASCIDKISKL